MDGNHTTKHAASEVVVRLCKIIERAIDDGRIKAEALAMTSLVSDSTISRIRNREVGDISFTTFVALLRNVDDTTRTQLHEIVDPGFVHVRSEISDEQMDVNGDGKVDLNDLLDMAAHVAQDSGEFQHGIREATRDKRMTPGEALKLNELVQTIRNKPRILSAIADRLASGNRRHKLPPLKLGGAG